MGGLLPHDRRDNPLDTRREPWRDQLASKHRMATRVDRDPLSHGTHTPESRGASVQHLSICTRSVMHRRLGCPTAANQSCAMRTPIESYVVRIYRCQGGTKRQVVGVVEAPRLIEAQSFTNVDQLWAILAGQGMSAPHTPTAKGADESNS